MKNPLLSIRNLDVYQSKQSRKIIQNLCLDIQPGEILGLVGSSGCGKSTLAKTLIGIQPILSGEIHYLNDVLVNQKTTFNKKHRKDIQIVFQDTANCLNPRMSVLSILLEPLQIHEKFSSKEEKISKVCSILEQVGLSSNYLKHYPHELSGGQKQRVCIARSLILQPNFLIFDEAVSALDASIQAQILNLLKRLKKELGFTLLFISHDMQIVHYISDRVAVMSQGQIVEMNTPYEIFNNATHPFTQRLVALSKKYID
jgi:peptide/nickel transport system ATP-binding protein